MNGRPRALSLTAISITIAGLLSACGGGSGTKTATATRTASPAVTSSAIATPLGIRTIDLSKVPDVRDLVASTDGAYVQTGVIYADLTGDGVDEAVVPISSGGTLGDVAFIVLALSGAGTKTLLKDRPSGVGGGLSVAVVGGQLVMTLPVYGPNDPNCCPSALSKKTYVWNGSGFTTQSVTTDANPGGGGKRTALPAGTPQ